MDKLNIVRSVRNLLIAAVGDRIEQFVLRRQAKYPQVPPEVLTAMASSYRPGSRLHRSRRLRLNIAKAMVGIAFEQMFVHMGFAPGASKLNYSQAAEQAQLNGTTTTVGNAGTLNIYSGTQPSATTGAAGTLVAGPFTMGSPFAAGASAALPSVLSPTLPANVNASTSVQPTWWRVATSGGTAVLDGSAGTSGCDMTMGPPTSGQPVAITSFTITSGNSGH